jgi:hypothetical protein
MLQLSKADIPKTNIHGPALSLKLCESHVDLTIAEFGGALSKVLSNSLLGPPFPSACLSLWFTKVLQDLSSFLR